MKKGVGSSPTGYVIAVKPVVNILCKFRRARRCSPLRSLVCIFNLLRNTNFRGVIWANSSYFVEKFIPKCKIAYDYFLGGTEKDANCNFRIPAPTCFKKLAHQCLNMDNKFSIAKETEERD